MGVTRRRALALAGAGAALATGQARAGRALAGEAQGVGAALYQATAIVTGSDERERGTGFARCLVEVVGKLTGDAAAAGSPEVVALAARAGGLVAGFEYADPRAGLLHHDDQGTYDRSYELTVRFDPGRVDAALAGLGLRVWAGARPLLGPVVLVRDREPAPFLLSAESGRGAAMRGALQLAAAAVGVGVRWPTEADLAAWGVGSIGPPAPLGEVPAGVARVVGTLSWNVVAMGWVGDWRMDWAGAARRWGERGVGFDVALGDLVRGAVGVLAGVG